MSDYMVIMKLPPSLNEEFMSLIPAQREQTSKLFEDGKLTSYSLALDRSFLWATVVAPDVEAVRSILKTLPLTKYMRKLNIAELYFHESMSIQLPQPSLN